MSFCSAPPLVLTPAASANLRLPYSIWAYTKELKPLAPKTIDAFLSDTGKKSGKLKTGYEIARDPSAWEAEQAEKDKAAAEAEGAESAGDNEGEDEDDEDVDMLAEDGEEKPSAAKKRKRAAGNGEDKPAKAPKKDTAAKGKKAAADKEKKAPASKAKKEPATKKRKVSSDRRRLPAGNLPKFPLVLIGRSPSSPTGISSYMHNAPQHHGHTPHVSPATAGITWSPSCARARPTTSPSPRRPPRQKQQRAPLQRTRLLLRLHLLMV